MRSIRGRLLAACLLSGAGVGWAMPPQDAVVERIASDRLSVSWKSADPVDVLVAERPAEAVSASRVVASRDSSGAVSIEAAGLPRSYFLLRNARTGESVRVAERVLPLEAGSNFRDIGGYPAAGGRHVRWGVVYRSGGTPLLTATDVERIRQLKLVNMVDLRSDEERVLAPTRIDGVPYTAVGYSFAGLDATGGMDTTYRRLPTMLAPQLRQIVDKLLRAEHPLVYNCSAGQDRTGFVTAMLLAAVGTPRELIIGDYHLSTKYRRPEFEMPRISPAAAQGNAAAELFARYQDHPAARQPQPLKMPDGTAYLDFAFAEIEAKWGSVDHYLAQEIGLDKPRLTRLRAVLTE